MTTSTINNLTNLSGEYRLCITRRDGTLEDTGWFKNIILDAGMERFPVGATISHISVGTGTSTPVVTQTGLDTFVASKTTGSASVINSGSPNYTSAMTFPAVFAQGAVVGNISEIGCWWSATNGSLFSRARILDTGGNPATITLTAIDQLTVYYRITVVPPINETTGSVTVAGIEYPYTMRRANANNAISSGMFTTGNGGGFPINNVSAYSTPSVIGAITGGPTGASTQSVALSHAPYSAGSNTRVATVTFGITFVNPIQSLVILYGVYGALNLHYMQMTFTTPIPKSNTNVLSLTFQTTWARA